MKHKCPPFIQILISLCSFPHSPFLQLVFTNFIEYRKCISPKTKQLKPFQNRYSSRIQATFSSLFNIFYPNLSSGIQTAVIVMPAIAASDTIIMTIFFIRLPPSLNIPYILYSVTAPITCLPRVPTFGLLKRTYQKTLLRFPDSGSLYSSRRFPQPIWSVSPDCRVPGRDGAYFR